MKFKKLDQITPFLHFFCAKIYKILIMYQNTILKQSLKVNI